MSSVAAGAPARPWLKAVLVALLLATLVATVRAGMALALARRDPAAALRSNGNSPAALAEIALRLAQTDQTPAGRRLARRRATAALALDPTNVSALTALGLATDDVARGRAIMTLSDRLSRRSLLTQLWLIEEAVRRDDVAGALRHYDTALRVSRLAAPMLFPVLVTATTDRALLPNLAAMLAARPAWGLQYLQQLAQSGTDLPNASALYEMLLRRDVPIGDAALVTLFQRLVDAQAYDTAWRLYAVLRPGARRAALRNGDFRHQPENPVAFDWRLSDNQTDLAAMIDRVSGAERLSFSASSGGAGTAARQLLLLGAGSHAAAATAFETASDPAQRPALRLVCAPTGVEIARLPLPVANDRGARGRWRFTVPTGCAAQWLEVSVPSAESFEPNTGAVSAITID